jgi:hypothetical protein
MRSPAGLPHSSRWLAGFDVKRDVVGVGAVDEGPVHDDRPAVGDRHERSIQPRIRKHDDDDRCASSPEGIRKQLRGDFAELFESKRHIPQASSGDIADHLEVVRTERAPLGRRLQRHKHDERRREEQDTSREDAVRHRVNVASAAWSSSILTSRSGPRRGNTRDTVRSTTGTTTVSVESSA